MAQVLVQRAETGGAGPYRKILVAVDGSENSRRAAKTATQLSRLMGAKLTVLAVVQLPLLVDQMGTMYGVGEYLEQAKKHLERVVDELVGEAAEEGVQAEGVVLDGSASVVQAITDYAAEKNFDLIVVGTRGLGGFKRLVLGSVSSGVVSHAHCSVLVVR